MNFGKIKSISLEEKVYLEKTIFLTFDIDWCCDEVLVDTINIVEKAEIAATWFVTHDTPLLSRMRENPRFELGIHPNFNNLLNGDSSNGKNAEEVIDRLLKIVPEAKSVRSHSMTQSSNLLQLFFNKGLTHDCNHFIPDQAEIQLKPWKLWNGLIKVPYSWEDDVHAAYGGNWQPTKSNKKGLKVYDFHPIHVFLNTEKLTRYEESRSFHQSSSKLKSFVNRGIGVRSYLEQLINKGE